MNGEVADILKVSQESMDKVIEGAKRDFSTIRTGRANPAILERVQVECYGSLTPLKQIAGISAPEPRLLVVQPWDKSIINDVEKAIQKADLGLNPTNDGTVIRLVIPQLTEERRKELVRMVKKDAEEKRVLVRNIRREAKEKIKKLEKDGQISEDESHKTMDEIQKLTDKYVAEVDKLLAAKEAEIMEV
ncbi:MAG TPA: ribosome recycling factor [Firmicutes bacterium]|jgi:ribosome recycling factor|nr:ribosome recycling factor [Bacillota bacterium]